MVHRYMTTYMRAKESSVDMSARVCVYVYWYMHGYIFGYVYVYVYECGFGWVRVWVWVSVPEFSRGVGEHVGVVMLEFIKRLIIVRASCLRLRPKQLVDPIRRCKMLLLGFTALPKDLEMITQFPRHVMGAICYTYTVYPVNKINVCTQVIIYPINWCRRNCKFDTLQVRGPSDFGI